MKCNSYLKTLIFSLVFLFLLPFNTLAANYGEGTYGSGNYNVGDSTAPSGGSITYLNGSQTSSTVAITVSDGTDADSGVDTSTRTVQRKSASLDGDTCGNYGGFGTITHSGTYPNFTDTSVSSGNCYQYQYLVSDTSSNQATYTSSNIVKITYQQSDATSCTSTTPTGTSPWLYSAVSNNSNSITLRFTNYQTPITHFVIEYGNKSGEYKYSVDNILKDVTSYTINKLNPSTTYFLRIRTGNDCATGSWSNELSTKTLGLFSFNKLQTTNTDIETVTNTKIVDNIENSKTSKNIEKTNEIEQTGYIVNIKVTNTKQEAIKGAKVTMHSDPKETTTDENGVAHFTNVEAGDHKVLIAYKNFTGEQSINLTGDAKEFNLNITVNEKKVLLSPFAYGVIGVLILIITVLTFQLKKKRDIKKLL